MNSQKTPHTPPFRASYGVSFMSTSTEIDRVIKGFYCITVTTGSTPHTLLSTLWAGEASPSFLMGLKSPVLPFIRLLPGVPVSLWPSVSVLEPPATPDNNSCMRAVREDKWKKWWCKKWNRQMMKFISLSGYDLKEILWLPHQVAVLTFLVITLWTTYKILVGDMLELPQEGVLLFTKMNQEWYRKWLVIDWAVSHIKTAEIYSSFSKLIHHMCVDTCQCAFQWQRS